jgi:hypothetical protein
VQNEPWLPRDRAMIDQLKTIGIEKGRQFNPDQATLAILDDAAREAHALLAQRYDEGFPVINPGIRWFPAAMAEMIKAAQSGYADPNAYPVDVRGVIYTLGFTGIKRIGTAQFYLMANKDKDGNFFDGGSTYWVPTDPAGKFELLFQLYGPEKPLFDHSWKLPDVEKVRAR